MAWLIEEGAIEYKDNVVCAERAFVANSILRWCAKKAKEKNDLLELYFICGKLNIDVDLDELDIKSLNKIIEKKKESLIQFEKSWIWAWANAKSDEERDTLVKKFNKNRK